VLVSGGHAGLVRLGGLYAELHELQASAYRLDRPYTPQAVRELRGSAHEKTELPRLEAGVIAEVVACGPYSLAVSARGAGDACRRFRGGELTALLETEGGAEIVRAQQRPDGVVVLSAASERGLELLRFELARLTTITLPFSSASAATLFSDPRRARFGGCDR
jgi:hypothetical protein